MSEKNIDELLSQVGAVTIPGEEVIAPLPVEEVSEESSVAESSNAPVESESHVEPVKEVPEPGKEAAESPIDDYGNPTEKPKMYTEEEVNRMMRERLARGRHAEQPTQQQVNDVAKDFKADPNSDESWEVQLESFIDKTIEKRQAKVQKEQWQEQERSIQAEFEGKFNAGMGKYKDFETVVSGKPLTNAMMLATRSMNDPAAFIYAAAKTQPKELERISQMRDPYQQATEIGRLEERMRKARNTISAAAKPIAPTKGDMPSKGGDRPNIDQLIQLDAKKRLKR